MSDIIEAPARTKSRTYSGVPAEERTRVRRERLLQAAKEVFGKLGYAHATMRNICVEARLAERYFYESFDSTRTIFKVVCQDEVDQLILAVSQALARSSVFDKQYVESGLRAFLEFIRQDPRRVQILLIDGIWMEQMRAREGEGEAGEAGMLGYARVIRSVAQGFHPDLAREINVDMAASGLMGMTVHSAIEWAREGFQMELDSVVKHNMFAWGGLVHWARSTHEAVQARSTQDEVRAWGRKAFQPEQDAA
jgi:AcrR family transcriptional regulator